ncbi:MAG: right-handed parallel beta-helix repeat-containing protein [Saprospiraceae bacterium]|nr:right-handed parallel beta-helix repeat-containing protein [Lewinella sp.]
MSYRVLLLHMASSLLLFFTIACSPASSEFYVSPDGDDNNNGSQEKPFATLVRARQAALQSLADQSGSATIWLQPGRHVVTESIVFKAEDFPDTTSRLYVKGIGEAILSGGQLLSNWQRTDDGLWMTQLPSGADSITYVRELFVNGRRAIRSRFPNEGYIRIARAGEDKRTHFFFGEGDFPLPQRAKDTELVLMHDWSSSRIPVQSIDTVAQILTPVDWIGARVLDFFTLDHWEEHPRYFLENDLRFIDQDYEWYFDPEARRIYLKLPAAQDINELEIIVPVAEGLLELEGTEEQPIRNVQIENVIFRHSAWNIPDAGCAGIQATYFDPRPNSGTGWSVVPAAVTTTYADQCIFTHCRFENLGGSGLWIGRGSTNNQVSDSQFGDISGNGLLIGEGQDRKVGDNPWWEKAPEQAARNNRIVGCTVTDCGVQYFGAVGIWCGLSAETTIVDNEVHHLPYTGISIGWMWSPAPTPARENRVINNHIHHIMQKLSDGGGIYMLGLQPGSELRGNHIHDVTVNVGRAESNGMFLDEGTTDVIVSDNIIYNIAKSPIRFHRATTNLVQDNFLFCTEGVPPFTYNATDDTLIEKIDNRVYQVSDNDYEAALQQAITGWQEKHQQQE